MTENSSLDNRKDKPIIEKGKFKRTMHFKRKQIQIGAC